MDFEFSAIYHGIDLAIFNANPLIHNFIKFNAHLAMLQFLISWRNIPTAKGLKKKYIAKCETCMFIVN